jgi:hypothetical protein
VGANLVVSEDIGLLATYAPHRAPALLPTVLGEELVQQLADGTWQLRPARRFNHTLFLSHPGDAHSINLIWNEDWSLLAWYVNLEAPFVRTANTFDTHDHQLDIVIAPDLSSWRWKDENHLALAVRLGVVSPEESESIRAEGAAVIARLDNREPPFCDDWPSWRPDPGWTPPSLPRPWTELT